MGLSWQQGPVTRAPAGAFLVRGPLPERMFYAEPLRRRMRVRLCGEWIADSEDVISLHEPGRYPVAYFPIAHVDLAELRADGYVSDHPDLGMTVWYDVELGGGHVAQRSTWEHTALPAYAEVLADQVAFAWQAMDGFYEEDEPIFGHASDPYHRIDVRRATRI